MAKDFEIGDAVFNRVRNQDGVVIGITFEQVGGFGEEYVVPFYLVSYKDDDLAKQKHGIFKAKQGDLEFINKGKLS